MNRTLMVTLAIALLMENIDATVIATSLPTIAADLGTSPTAVKLALTAYLVSLAVFVPISGWLCQRYQARNVFCIAIVVFLIGSIGAAMAWSLGSIVAARFVQGMGGAMMTPVARLILVRATPREALVAAMTWLMMPAMIGPLAGPALGGFLTTYFSWHWIFLANVPVGLIGIVLGRRVIPDFPPAPPSRMDFVGFVLIALAASGIVFGLSVISLPALPASVGVGAVVAGILAAELYRRHSRRVANPVLQLALFSNRTFRAAVIGGAIFRMPTGAMPFLLPLLFQLSFGLNPFQSGLLTLTSAIGATMVKFLVGTALRRLGFRGVCVLTAIFGGLAMAVSALFVPGTPYPLIIAAFIFAGTMRSLFFTANATLVFVDLPEADTAQASAIASVSQQISVALGVAVAGAVLELVGSVTGVLGREAFIAAFLAMGAIAVASSAFFWRLPPDTGSAVSGHQHRAAEAADDPER